MGGKGFLWKSITTELITSTAFSWAAPAPILPGGMSWSTCSIPMYLTSIRRFPNGHLLMPNVKMPASLLPLSMSSSSLAMLSEPTLVSKSVRKHIVLPRSSRRNRRPPELGLQVSAQMLSLPWYLLMVIPEAYTSTEYICTRWFLFYQISLLPLFFLT